METTGFEWTLDALDRFCQVNYPDKKVRRTFTRDDEWVTVAKNPWNVAYLRPVHDARQGRTVVMLREGRSDAGSWFGGWLMQKLARNGAFFKDVKKRIAAFEAAPSVAALSAARLLESPWQHVYLDRRHFWSVTLLLVVLVILGGLMALMGSASPAFYVVMSVIWILVACSWMVNKFVYWTMRKKTSDYAAV